jgi:hypothetical protein
MVRLTFGNYKECAIPGRKIVYGKAIGKIEADAQYSDGICVHGRSIKSILEDFNEVYVLTRYE